MIRESVIWGGQLAEGVGTSGTVDAEPESALFDHEKKEVRTRPEGKGKPVLTTAFLTKMFSGHSTSWGECPV